MNIRIEESIGSWVAILALLWGAHISLTRLSAGQAFLLPTNQLEIAAIGVLIWIHAKWRRSVTAK